MEPSPSTTWQSLVKEVRGCLKTRLVEGGEGSEMSALVSLRVLKTER